MSTSPVRIGLIGYGSGGRLFHAPLIASAAGCEFAGVVTMSAERRALLARDHAGVPAYDSLPALAAAGVSAVAVSTPAATRTALVREAIELGLAVVADKPFAPDAATAAETVRRAERAGLVLSVYQNRRWDSDLLTLRRLMTAGRLGAIHRFESRFERFRPDDAPRGAGGGMLLDLGSHLVDQALILFGPVDRVYAELRVPPASDLDDDFFVALHHRDGVLAHLWGSSIQGAPGPRLRVAGAAGAYTVELLDGQEEALRDGRTPATEGDRWGEEPAARWGHLHRGDVSEPVPSERGRWDSFYPAFAAAVRGDGPVPVDPWDAVAALRVMDAARTSATSGQTVVIGGQT
jgi:predicted dehydrogenase